jgi:hypothetical protein
LDERKRKGGYNNQTSNQEGKERKRNRPQVRERIQSLWGFRLRSKAYTWVRTRPSLFRLTTHYRHQESVCERGVRLQQKEKKKPDTQLTRTREKKHRPVISIDIRVTHDGESQRNERIQRLCYDIKMLSTTTQHKQSRNTNEKSDARLEEHHKKQRHKATDLYKGTDTRASLPICLAHCPAQFTNTSHLIILPFSKVRLVTSRCP